MQNIGVSILAEPQRMFCGLPLANSYPASGSLSSVFGARLRRSGH